MSSPIISTAVRPIIDQKIEAEALLRRCSKSTVIAGILERHYGVQPEKKLWRGRADAREREKETAALMARPDELED